MARTVSGLHYVQRVSLGFMLPPKTLFNQQINYLFLLAGLLAWLTVLLLTTAEQNSVVTPVFYAVGFTLFLLGYLLVDFLRPSAKKFNTVSIGIALQLLAVFICLFTTKDRLIYVLLVVLFGQMTFVVSKQNCFLILVLANLLAMAIFKLYWHEPWGHVIVQALLFLSFQFFAYAAGQIAVRETTARTALQLSNAELKSTRSLLQQSVRQGERLNISRDLHDICGHQLTALILNLEFAAKTALKESGQTVETLVNSKILAKTLLNEIRQVVKDIRLDNFFDLRAAIQQLCSALPGINLSLHYDQSLNISSQRITECLLRITQEAVTNAVRHAKSKTISISVTQSDTTINLNVTNPGLVPNHYQLGSGLNGIKERAEQLGGKLALTHPDQYTWSLTVYLPKPELAV